MFLPMIRGFRYRLYPTAAQAERLGQWIGATRFVYNLCLEQRRTWGRSHQISWVQQSREVTDLRKDFPWIADVPRDSLEQAVRDLDVAFSRFFGGIAQFPTNRVRGRNDSVRFRGRDVQIRQLNAKWAAINLPKIGELKFRLSRSVIGELRNATVSVGIDGWHVSVLAERDAETPPACDLAIGVDRGVACTLALSNGDRLCLPNGHGLERRVRRAAKRLAARHRGSARYAKQRARLAKLRRRQARIRTDWLHRESTVIARRYGVVAIEDLNVLGMTRSAKGTTTEPGRGVRQKAGLNRAILAQGWGGFARMLEYKLEAAGGRLLTCSPAYTSQTCAACGVIDAGSRKSQAVFECVACGHRDNADVNAAKEILRRSTSGLLVEAPCGGADEARTREAA